jgi:ubiquinone/menaquinone biosynthesis C-methylase UbiE
MQAVPPQQEMPQAALVRRYDRVAGRWHSRIASLGYPAAYTALAMHAEVQLQHATAGTDHPSILDVGAGSGAFSLAFAEQFIRRKPAGSLQFTLLDPSQAMLNEARLRLDAAGLRTECFCAALETLPQTSTFDVILCSHVIEHLTDAANGLRIIRRMLRAGGVALLVISKPHWCTTLLRHIWGHRHFSHQQVEAMLTAAGFAEVISMPFLRGPPSRTSVGYIAVTANEGFGKGCADVSET